MPLPTAHFALARLALHGCAGDAAGTPFDASSAAARNAYYHGALGPDMGFFPGGEPMLSQLAHGYRPGGLARALVARARTDVERAFAWGWLTHVVADVAIHPVVNECARRLVVAMGGDAADPHALAIAHSRVELGMDVRILTHDPGLRQLRLRHVFDAGSAEYLAGAYAAAYGLSFNREWLLRSHRAVAPLARALLLLERLHAHAAPHRPGSLRRGLLCSLSRAVGARLSDRDRAFLHPIRPSRTLLAAYDRTAASFRSTMRRLQLDGLASLGEPDLDGNTAPLPLSA